MPTSTTLASKPNLPIPIFQPSSSVPRYLLYDITHISYLRMHHAILGVLIGTLPQIPQQSVFLGLPLELQPEEAQLLIDKGIAYIVNDRAWHDGDFRQKCGAEREAIIERLRNEGLEISRGLRTLKKDRTRQILQEQERKKERGRREPATATSAQTESEGKVEGGADAVDEESLFSSQAPPPRSQQAPPRSRSTSSHDPKPWTITPTTTTSLTKHPPPAPPTTTTTTINPGTINPHTYPFFANLNSRGYYLSPGLRFGCHFSVYPGDPLRFHSHFLANAYGWEEEIELLDIVGGGRLGTGVKKGWLVGGLEEGKGEGGEGNEKGKGGEVRYFCVEWGGM